MPFKGKKQKYFEHPKFSMNSPLAKDVEVELEGNHQVADLATTDGEYLRERTEL